MILGEIRELWRWEESRELWGWYFQGWRLVMHGRYEGFNSILAFDEIVHRYIDE